MVMAETFRLCICHRSELTLQCGLVLVLLSRREQKLERWQLLKPNHTCLPFLPVGSIKTSLQLLARQSIEDPCRQMQVNGDIEKASYVLAHSSFTS